MTNISHSMEAWLTTDRDQVVGGIVDKILNTMSEEELRKTVWHNLFDELIYANYRDLLDYAEEYAPDLVPEIVKLK